ncbi:MAG: hypothetical protein CBC12_05450 [Candidatus Puniceispirillum sp. TMED52]|nr:MAG: hypothetical protein CBC12_05450 [Candidatus Puniceispirillum sp. TMED52]RPF82270.1 MAG: hypothetical protein CBC65_000825 [Rhodothermaceae bacterium TMED105]
MLTYSSTREKPVRPSKLRFGLLSAEEVRKISVVQVTDTTLYYRGLPNSGGLLDPLMGSVDRRHLCASCMRDARSCQGHVGYIELAYPMYHTGFVDTVLKILRTVCFTCSRLCATEEDLASIKDTNGRHKLAALHNLLKSRKQCPHCGMCRPSFQRLPLGLKIDWPSDMEWECDEEKEFCTAHFTAKEALSILKNMTNADCEHLGFDPHMSHPKNMILQTLVVPPPCTRPAIYASEGSRSRGQNDLTVKLLDCLKRSLELEAHFGCKWQDVTELSLESIERIARLQYEVFSIVNSNVRGYKPTASRGGHAQKTLSERLKGKEGRVRGNLMGKRVDFSARCVITPDPYFACDRVGVPYTIAKTLTVPETVNSINIIKLTKRVRMGSTDVKGAETIIHTDGSVTNLAHTKDRESIILKYGEVVERHLDDDDIVVFNRQPSLHKHGMQAHRVRLMPGHTFRLSLVVAAPYNADFDGDEMNLHVPQSLAARAECSTLLSVTQNIVGPQSNKPTMGIVQDSLLGLHLLSLPGSAFSHRDTCRMIGSTLRTKKTLDKPALVINSDGKVHRFWTGKQIFSKVLPGGLYVEPESLSADALVTDDATLIVRNGRLLMGTLRKAHVGTASGGIVDVICREFGGHACCRFFDDAQRLTHSFLLIRGHEVGIHDVMLSKEGHDKVSERLAKATHLCEEIQKEVSVDDVPADVALTAERSILRLLSKTLMQCGSIVNEHMDEKNAIRRMVGGGSKGTFINLSQICAALGQQSLEGSRITADKGNRTLPCFGSDDLSLASRGFVTNSYALGLSPTDLFFHAIGGREGLVDTAVKTSQTGYLQRRMNKSFEDHLTHTDGTIRNALGEVISFKWGSDGMHPALLERVKLGVLNSDVQKIQERMNTQEASLFFKLREDVLYSKVNVLTSELDLRVLLPFNPSRVRNTIRRMKSSSRKTKSVHGVVSPEYASNVAIQLATRVNTPSVVGVSILDLCCASAVADLNKEYLDEVIQTLKNKIDAAQCPTGESVGSLAAQSTGEPCTQMTLNTFHFAGVSAKNVTLGIPKLKELVDASKSPKTPLTVVRFREPYSQSSEFADYFANTLPLTRLTDIVLQCDIVYDPDINTSSTEDDVWMVELDRAINPEFTIESYSSYVVRMDLHREVMRTRLLNPPTIRAMLRERLGNRAHVISSETNSVSWIVRIRFGHVASMQAMGNLAPDQEAIMIHRAANMLLDTVLVCGHPHVTSAAAVPACSLKLSTAPVTIVDRGEEQTVLAYGTFLSDCAASDVVDWERCTSNDVWEVLNMLGIEACAHVLFDQIKTVISFDGQYVDDRHLALIVDSMCRNGKLVPLNRHGINKADTSPLMRASFEETIDVLCDAAIYAETENARGVTTSIMTGQLGEFGSGTADVLFHTSCLPSFRAEQSKGDTCKKRVLRSTCRSFVENKSSSQTVEYVFNDVKPSAARSLTPVEDSNPSGVNMRQRARFRPVSPV